MKKNWIVNAIAHSPLCGLRGSVVGIYSSEDDAKFAVHKSIEAWRNAHEDEGVEVNFDSMEAWYDYDPNDGCKWFVTAIEIA